MKFCNYVNFEVDGEKVIVYIGGVTLIMNIEKSDLWRSIADCETVIIRNPENMYVEFKYDGYCLKITTDEDVIEYCMFVCKTRFTEILYQLDELFSSS